MKYEIIQTAPYPTAEFTFQRKSGDIGTAKWTCDKKTWKVEIRFDGISIQMIYDKRNDSICSMIKDLFTFSPPRINSYQLVSKGKQCGEIFKCQGYYWLRLNECRYSACAIGFGSAGIKYPVFDGSLDKKYNPTGKQTALIETSNSGKLLDLYHVASLDSTAGVVAMLFGLYIDYDAFYKSDRYSEKTYLESYGHWKQLYDPAFKEHIAD